MVADLPLGDRLATGIQPDSMTEGINVSDKTKEMASRVLAFVEANPDVLRMSTWVSGLSHETPLRPGDSMPPEAAMCVAVIAAHLDGYTVSFNREEWEYELARGDTSAIEGFSDAGKRAFDIDGWGGHTPHLFVIGNRPVLKVLSALAAGVEYSDEMVEQVVAAEFKPVRTADDA